MGLTKYKSKHERLRDALAEIGAELYDAGVVVAVRVAKDKRAEAARIMLEHDVILDDTEMQEIEDIEEP